MYDWLSSEALQCLYTVTSVSRFSAAGSKGRYHGNSFLVKTHSNALIRKKPKRSLLLGVLHEQRRLFQKNP